MRLYVTLTIAFLILCGWGAYGSCWEPDFSTSELISFVLFLSGLGWPGFVLCLLAALACLASFLCIYRNRVLWPDLRPQIALLAWGILAGIYGLLFVPMLMVGPVAVPLAALACLAATTMVVVVLSKHKHLRPYGAATAVAWTTATTELAISGALLWMAYLWWVSWTFANSSID